MKRIFLILMMAVGFATIALANENREISGTVTDESGAALPGVSICVENTSRGTLSDVNGFYKIIVDFTRLL